MSPILFPRNVYIGTALLLLACCLSCSALQPFGKRPSSTTNQAKRQRTGGKVMEPAFENAGDEAGLQVWRIEDFKPVAYPKANYGKFYTGDSYIVLNTKINKRGEKSWDIHFWLGAETTQDEAGSAAIFTVQLDDQLGGAALQYRETQDHESQLFLSYFKGGVRYLPGGVSSGFTHVDPDAFEKKLFQVKGLRNIRVKQVEPTIASMNKGDCFILDVGKNIYVYVGEKSQRIERLKAINAANQIRDQDHAGKAKVHIVDEFSSEDEFTTFFQELGEGDASSVPDESAGGDDSDFESSDEQAVALYRVTDDGGSVHVELVSERPLQQSMLESHDCFILDTTDAHIYVWVGRNCNNQEKQEAMKKAQSFIQTKNYPAWTHIQRIVEEAEPTAFAQYFQSWKTRNELHARLIRSSSTESENAFEPRLFHAVLRKGKRRGRGRLHLEEVIDFEQEDLNEDDIMLLDIGKELFIWFGNGASDEEKEKADKVAQKYLAKYNREDVTVTNVNQGEEPDNFQLAFPDWSGEHWENVSSYDSIKARIAEENSALSD